MRHLPNKADDELRKANEETPFAIALGTLSLARHGLATLAAVDAFIKAEYNH